VCGVVSTHTHYVDPLKSSARSFAVINLRTDGNECASLAAWRRLRVCGMKIIAAAAEILGERQMWPPPSSRARRQSRVAASVTESNEQQP
jgi:hypothetical protein